MVNANVQSRPRGRLACLALSGLAWAVSMSCGMANADEPRRQPIAFVPPGPPLSICSNAPFGGPVYRNQVPGAPKAAYDSQRLWPVGKKIAVRFLNGQGDPWVEKVQQKVREIAPTWGQYANLSFDFNPQGDVDLTVNFYPFIDNQGNIYNYGLFNCFLGTDTKLYLNQVQSMNLLFDPLMAQRYPADFVESEFRRLILHEFGHATGLIHEHQRPDRPIAWSIGNLNAYAKSVWNWNPDVVKSQIVDVYPGLSLVGTVFDVRSIMEYQYPSGLAFYTDSNGSPDYGRPFQAPNNTELTALDKVAASVTYPLRATPTEEVLLSLDQPQDGSIQEAGQVARYRIQVMEAGNYAIEASGPMPLILAALARTNPVNGRGLPNNVLGAKEASNAPATVSLRSTLPANYSFVLEVRHQKPLVKPEAGADRFTIALRKAP